MAIYCNAERPVAAVGLALVAIAGVVDSRSGSGILSSTIVYSPACRVGVKEEDVCVCVCVCVGGAGESATQ